MKKSVTKSTKSTKSAKSAKSAKKTKPTKSAKSGKASRAARPAKPAKSAKPAKPAKPNKANRAKKLPHSKSNGYRKDSNYALAFDCLAHYSRKKPYPRKELIERYSSISGLSILKSGYNLAVILSPTLQDDGTLTHHRSSEKATRQFAYHVIKENGMVQLVIIK